MQALGMAAVALAAWLGACAGARAQSVPRLLAAAPRDPVRLQPSSAAPDPAAGAPGKPADSDAGDWEVIPYTYIWLPWVDVDVSAGGSSVSTRVDPSDLLKDLKLAYLGGVEFEYRKRWIAGLDINYFDLAQDTEVGPAFTTVGPLRIEAPGAVLTVPGRTAIVGPLDVDVDLKMFIARGILGYRLLSRPMPEFLGGAGTGGKRTLNLDAYAGGRLWILRTEVDVDGPPIGLPGTTGTVSFPSRPNLALPGISIPAVSTGPVDFRTKQTEAWVDPIVGGRLRADLSDRFLIGVGGNVGGFDWGSASKLTWEAVTTVGVRFKERWTAEGGYRALAVERVKGDVQADVIQHGPLVGISRRF